MDEKSPAPTTAAPATQEIKDVLALVIDAAKLGIEAEADGKLTFADALTLMKLVPDLGPAISGMSQVPAELAALGPASEAELIAFVTGRLVDAQGPRAALITQKALAASVAAFELVQAIRG